MRIIKQLPNLILALIAITIASWVWYIELQYEFGLKAFFDGLTNTEYYLLLLIQLSFTIISFRLIKWSRKQEVES